MTGFTKLWSTIVHSTVWQEPLHVKVTWVTMLALSDARGYVGASIPGLASAAGVTIEQCEESLAKFLAPDKYSRTQEHEGRRVEVEEGGWRLLNYDKHRAARGEEERRIQNREAQTRFRAKLTVSNGADSKQSKPVSAQAEAEAEAETTKASTSGKPESKKPEKAKPWVSEGHSWWVENVGVITPPRFATALSPTVSLYGWPKVFSALKVYVEDSRHRGKPCKPEWCAAEIVRWVEWAAMPATDSNGDLTPRGKAILGQSHG